MATKKESMVVEESQSAAARSQVTIGRDDLNWATDEGVITEKQADALWSGLSTRAASKPRFDLPNLAWYTGAVIVMLAMGWFLVQVWDLYSGGAILATAIAYALFFFLSGYLLWKRDDLKVPGGLLVTLGVFMTPLAVYGAERLLGLWGSGANGDINRLIMEMATVVAGFVALNFVRFPFITAPLSVAIWITGMELISLLYGNSLGWQQWQTVTLCFGLVMMVGSYLVDRRTSDDFSFWGYLIGASAFWTALSTIETGSELGRFCYFLINIGLMLVSVLLSRRVFVIYGAMGVIWYLAHLTFTVFADSMMFPIALSLMGLLVIWLGIKYHQNRARIEGALLGVLPASIRDWLPTSRQ